jgi:hypothetical protein
MANFWEKTPQERYAEAMAKYGGQNVGGVNQQVDPNDYQARYAAVMGTNYQPTATPTISLQPTNAQEAARRGQPPTTAFDKDYSKNGIGAALVGSAGAGIVNTGRQAASFIERGLANSMGQGGGSITDAFANAKTKEEEDRQYLKDNGFFKYLGKKFSEINWGETAGKAVLSPGLYNVGKAALDTGVTDVNKLVKPVEDKINKWADVDNEGWVVKMAAGALQSIPQTLLTAVNPVVGIPIMFNNAYQNTAEQFKAQGRDINDPTVKANMLGTSVVEVATEYMFNFAAGMKGAAGALSAMGAKTGVAKPLIAGTKGFFEQFFKQEGKMIKPTIGAFLVHIAKQGAEEGVEEVFSEIGGGLVALATTDKGRKIITLGNTVDPVTGEDTSGAMTVENMAMAFGSAFLSVGLMATVNSHKQFVTAKKFVTDNFSDKSINEITQAELDAFIEAVKTDTLKSPELQKIAQDGLGNVLKDAVASTFDGTIYTNTEGGDTLTAHYDTKTNEYVMESATLKDIVRLTPEQLEKGISEGRYQAQTTAQAPQTPVEAPATPGTENITPATAEAPAPSRGASDAVLTKNETGISFATPDGASHPVTVTETPAVDGTTSKSYSAMLVGAKGTSDVEAHMLPGGKKMSVSVMTPARDTTFEVDANEYLAAPNKAMFLNEKSDPVGSLSRAYTDHGEPGIYEAVTAVTDSAVEAHVETVVAEEKAKQEEKDAKDAKSAKDAKDQADIKEEVEIKKATKGKESRDIPADVIERTKKQRELVRTVQERSFSKEDMAALRAVDKDMDKLGMVGWLVPVSEDGNSPKMKWISDMLKTETGKRIVFVTAVGSLEINEFVSDFSKDTVFVNISGKSDKSVAWAIGHGLYHLMVKDGKGEVFADAVRKFLPENAVADYLATYDSMPAYKRQLEDSGIAMEEIIADHAGEAFASSKFWEGLIAPTVGKQKKSLRKIIADFFARLNKEPGIAESEITAFTEAFNEYKEPAPAPAVVAKSETTEKPVVSNKVELTNPDVVAKIIKGVEFTATMTQEYDALKAESRQLARERIVDLKPGEKLGHPSSFEAEDKYTNRISPNRKRDEIGHQWDDRIIKQLAIYSALVKRLAADVVTDTRLGIETPENARMTEQQIGMLNSRINALAKDYLDFAPEPVAKPKTPMPKIPKGAENYIATAQMSVPGSTKTQTAYIMKRFKTYFMAIMESTTTGSETRYNYSQNEGVYRRWKGDLNWIQPNSIKERESDEVETKFSISPNLSEIEQKAIDYFGTTYRLSEAGFVLQDGTLLDLSEKKNGGQPGTRSQDHREVSALYPSGTGQTESLDKFLMETNALRMAYLPNYALFTAMGSTPISDAQRSIIMRSAVHKESVVFDYYATDMDSSATQVWEFDMPSVATVKRMIEEINEAKAASVVQPVISEEITNEQAQALADIGAQVDEASESVAPTLYSFPSLQRSDLVLEREAASISIQNATGVTKAQADKWIEDVMSVASIVLAGRDRLFFDPSPHVSFFKTNVEYFGSLDSSTICAKRRLAMGTLDAIQKRFPTMRIASEDLMKVRQIMQRKELQIACGICYVESTRKDLGKYVDMFIDLYKESQKSGQPMFKAPYKEFVPDPKKPDMKEQPRAVLTWDKSKAKNNPGRTYTADKDFTPTITDLNTTDGIENLRDTHPEVYEAFVGVMNGLNQQKPKLLEKRTEYRNEIWDQFDSIEKVEEMNRNGGIRFNSFSDFEVPHALDMMQAVMDMARRGLKGQAFTKVINFSMLLGGTGVKINIGVIPLGLGVDADGNLIFDDIEGANHKEAIRAREKNPKDVGLIMVGKNDIHIRASMKSGIIDFIIPFHRSQWSKAQYEALGIAGYSDYTIFQNESYVVPVLSESGKKLRPENFRPNDYWDFSLTGEQNADAYIEMCTTGNRIPKFIQFAFSDADIRKFLSTPDGNKFTLEDFTDTKKAWKMVRYQKATVDKFAKFMVMIKAKTNPGYWKQLVDFKMYDNNGIGSPQQPVVPQFDIVEAERMLDEYHDDPNTFPVAQDVVDEFAAWKSGTKYSINNALEFGGEVAGHPAFMSPMGNWLVDQVDVKTTPVQWLKKFASAPFKSEHEFEFLGIKDWIESQTESLTGAQILDYYEEHNALFTEEDDLDSMRRPRWATYSPGQEIVNGHEDLFENYRMKSVVMDTASIPAPFTNNDMMAHNAWKSVMMFTRMEDVKAGAVPAYPNGAVYGVEVQSDAHSEAQKEGGLGYAKKLMPGEIGKAPELNQRLVAAQAAYDAAHDREIAAAVELTNMGERLGRWNSEAKIQKWNREHAKRSYELRRDGYTSFDLSTDNRLRSLDLAKAVIIPIRNFEDPTEVLEMQDALKFYALKTDVEHLEGVAGSYLVEVTDEDGVTSYESDQEILDVVEIGKRAVEYAGIYRAANRDSAEARISMRAAEKAVDKQQTPDLPFKKDYPLLGFKMWLRDAIATGKDAVMWAGWMHAKRWMVKENYAFLRVLDVQEVESKFGLKIRHWDVEYYGRSPDESSYSLRTVKLSANRLDTELGKWMSDKVFASKPGDVFYGQAPGQTNGFIPNVYDVTLVNSVNKYIKKWGVKAEYKEVENLPGMHWVVEINDAMRFELEQVPQVLYSITAEHLFNKNFTPENFEKPTLDNITMAAKFYQVQGHRETWRKVASMIQRDPAGTRMDASDITKISPEMTVARMVYMYMDQVRGRHADAAQWAYVINKANKGGGQAIEAVKMFQGLAPAGILSFALKRIQSFLKEDDLKRIEAKAVEAAGVITQADLDALRKLLSEKDAIVNALKNENSALKSKMTAAETLEERIKKYMRELGEFDADPVKDFVDILHGVATTVFPATKLPKTQDPVQFMRWVLKNNDNLNSLWKTAMEMFNRLYANDAVGRAEVMAYFNEFIPGGSKIDPANYSAQMLRNIGHALEAEYSSEFHTFQSMVKRLLELGVTDRDAITLARHFQKAVGDLSREEKVRTLRKILPRSGESGARLVIERIINISNERGLTSTEIQGYVAHLLGLPSLSPELAKELMDMAQKIADINEVAAKAGRVLTAEEQREVDVQTALIMARIASQRPVNWTEKVDLIQSMSMLSMFKSSIRNILGNTGFGVVDTLKDYMSVAIDRATSVFTGQKTIPLPQWNAAIHGAITGAKHSAQDIMMGIDTSVLDTGYSVEKGDILKSKLGKLMMKVFRFKMSLPDRVAQGAWYESHLKGLMKMKGETEASQDSIDAAVAFAEYKTFTDDNPASTAFGTLRSVLNGNITKASRSKGNGQIKWGLGSILIKFPRVPGALLMRTIEYSPISLARALWTLAKPIYESKRFGGSYKENFAPAQKKFATQLANGIFGTAITIGMGLLLTALGLMSGREPEDKKKRDANAAMGITGYQMNWDGLWRFVSSGFNPDAAKMEKGDNLTTFEWMSPMSLGLAIGANLYQETKTLQGADIAPFEKFSQIALVASLSGLESITEMSLMQGISALFDNTGYRSSIASADREQPYFGERLINAAVTVPASFIPNALKVTRELLDNTRRYTYSTSALEYAYNVMLNKIPEAEKLLPPSVDVYGNLKEIYQANGNNWGNVFFNPSVATKYTPSYETMLVLNTMVEKAGTKYDSSNVSPSSVKTTIDVTVNGVKQQLVLDAKERMEMQELVGKNVVANFKRIPASATVEQKVKAMQEIMSQVSAAAKEFMAKKKLGLD